MARRDAGWPGRPGLNDIAGQVRDRDRDRYLAALYVPAPVRPALMALWALDLELAAVVRAARDPMVAEIKLAWWREALDRLDSAPPPAQPLLQALAAEVMPHGVTGAQLATLEARWLPLLDPEAEVLPPAFVEGGAILFGLAGHVLGGDPAVAARLGGEWALGERCRSIARGAHVPAVARQVKVPLALRPLLGLVHIGRRDRMRYVRGPAFWSPIWPEPRGTPGRQLALLLAVALGR